jgi:hypothetical protein
MLSRVGIKVGAIVTMRGGGAIEPTIGTGCKLLGCGALSFLEEGGGGGNGGLDLVGVVSGFMKSFESQTFESRKIEFCFTYHSFAFV